MSTVLKNEIVSLVEKDDKWEIQHNDTKVGIIATKSFEQDFQIFFEIDPQYQQNHYGANAVFLLTPYIHQTLGIRNIHAVIAKDNEMARHIAEHNGYAIASENENEILYSHAAVSTVKDDAYNPEGLEVLYLAGGCFWGMEKVFQVLDGVTQTRTGYANGTIENPTYEQVCRKETGYKETVRVTYDPKIVSASTVLKAYFMCIDPTQKDGQAHDIGEQYQTGIYYRDEKLGKEVEQLYNREKQKYDEFYVECKPLECFYEAEEYHQDYLTKNPNGYCHISFGMIQKVKQLNKCNEEKSN